MIQALIEVIAEALIHIFGETVWEYFLRPIFSSFRWLAYHLIGAPFRLLGTMVSAPFDRKDYPSFKTRYYAGGNARIGLMVLFVIGMVSLMRHMV